MEIKDIRGGEDEEVSLFLNMVGLAPANELSSGDILKAMELDVKASLPFDPKTFVKLESEGATLSADKAGKDYHENTIVPFTAQIFGVQQKTSAKPSGESAGVFSGLLGKIGKK